MKTLYSGFLQAIISPRMFQRRVWIMSPKFLWEQKFCAFDCTAWLSPPAGSCVFDVHLHRCFISKLINILYFSFNFKTKDPRAVWDSVALYNEQIYPGFPFSPASLWTTLTTHCWKFLPPSSQQQCVPTSSWPFSYFGPLLQLLTLGISSLKLWFQSPAAPGEFIHFHVSWITPWITHE